MLLGTGIVCGIGPDVDEPRATISKWLRVALAIAGLMVGATFLLRGEWKIAIAAALAGVLAGGFRLPVPHRGPTHSLLAAALVAGAADYWIAPLDQLLFAAVAGGCWLLHIALDLTNLEPCMVWWPLPRKVWGPRLLQAREGSLKGNLEEGVVWAASSLWMVWVGLGALGEQAAVVQLVRG